MSLNSFSLEPYMSPFFQSLVVVVVDVVTVVVVVGGRLVKEGLSAKLNSRHLGIDQTKFYKSLALGMI